MMQRVAKTIGSSGCYLISLLSLYGYEAQALSLYPEFVRARWMDEDCFIREPAAILNFIDNSAEHQVYHAPADYIPARGEREILRFELVDTGATYAHFVVGDGHGGVAYDPLGTSRTVKYGRLISKRIVRAI